MESSPIRRRGQDAEFFKHSLKMPKDDIVLKRGSRPIWGIKVQKFSIQNKSTLRSSDCLHLKFREIPIFLL